MTAYAPEAIEAKWQGFWQDNHVFTAHPHQGKKYYCYNPAPYVTGNLHMGHVRNYTYGDFLTKVKRLHGENVLYTIGFDAFGVPTELAAMRERMDPSIWTARCIEGMKRQMTRLGLGFDWERSFCTADPAYYKWTQWIFVEMFREGLVYERDAESLWCPKCEMALAKSLTISGKCCLCGAGVETRWTRQWFLRVTAYLDRLRLDLAEVRDHNGQASAGQECLLARRSLWGVELECPEARTRIQACLESPADWSKDLVLALHPQDWETMRRLGVHSVAGAPGGGSNGGQGAHTPGTRSPTGLTAIEPCTRRSFPVHIDSTLDALYEDQPALVPLDPQRAGLPAWELPLDGFRPLVVYEQKDFSISRQRLWGTPIPILHCDACGPVAVASEDLPVLLPAIGFDDAGRLRRFDGHAESRECSACGRSAKLDPQVMDCHFDALWHYCRPCVPPERGHPFEDKELQYWMPVDQIQFGRDTIPFLLTMRLFSKFLHDRHLLRSSEFAKETLAHGLILKDNKKMSKHLGNVVDPMRCVETHGADSLRFCVLARSEPASDYSWSDNSVLRYSELLQSFYDDVIACAFVKEQDVPLAEDVKARKYTEIFLAKVLREVSILESSVERGRFDIYARAVARLLVALHVFKSRYYGQAGSWAHAAWALCVERSAIYLAPIAPHLAEECFERLGGRGSVFAGRRWPSEGVSELRRLLDAARGEGSGEARRRDRPVAEAH